MKVQRFLAEHGEFISPDHWEWAYLGKLVESIQPGFPCGQHNQIGKGILHLRPMNISPVGEISLDEVKYVEIQNAPNLKVGDILFNNTNSPVWLGKAASIRRENNWTFSNHMTRIRLYENTINSVWLALYLHYLQMIGFFKMYCAHHVNQASINTTFLAEEVFIPIPPKAEQQRIVEAIESHFTRLDAGIAALKRLQANLKRYKASVLKAACEGQLVPQNPDDEPASELLARILAERRAKWEAEQLAQYEAKGKTPPKGWQEKYQEPQPPDIDELPELPEGWVWASFDELLEELKNGYFGGRPANEPPGIPILTIGAVRPLSVDLTSLKYVPDENHKLSTYELKEGDLLFTRYNGNIHYVGVCGMVRNLNDRMLYPDKLIRAKLASDEISSDYIEIYFATELPRNRIENAVVSTAGQNGVSGPVLKRIPVVLPPVKQQELIVENVAAILSVVEKIEMTVDDNLKRAERLRQSILKEAFAGRLVPQDPKDEPASVLLERIRAAKGLQ